MPLMSRKEWDRIRAMHILKEMLRLVKQGEEIPNEYDKELCELVEYSDDEKDCALIPHKDLPKEEKKKS